MSPETMFATSVEGSAAAPIFRRISSKRGEHLFVIPYSRLFDLPAAAMAAIDRGDVDLESLAATLALPAADEAPLDRIADVTPQAISLNVSAGCNLSCSYCYAGRGSFGGAQPRNMTWETARAAIDRLFLSANRDARITVGFLGGEPLTNRGLIEQSVAYSCGRAHALGLTVGFSITTNGTLLRKSDCDLFRRHPFAVTVSVDGGAALHDLQRPAATRTKSSFAMMADAIRPLLADPGQAKIAARATVTRRDLNLHDRFQAILALGFSEVGFAPLRTSADASGALQDEDWQPYLAAIIDVAQGELSRGISGDPIRLTNFGIALKQIARGFSSPYPCGAGGGYFSVAAEGQWYACHRAIGRDEFLLGNNQGLDVVRRRKFLTLRHVHSQPACQTCWARYLCSGGCHQEATARNESGCGFIRGWLDFCLRAYCELSSARPDMFAATNN